MLLHDAVSVLLLPRPDALKEFLAAARAQGFTVSISRTYMSYPDQRTRFNGMASTIYDRGEMSLADAEKKVTEMGYYPGADEHQTGLAVNFVGENAEAKFSTPVLEWMREHCAEYGFIIRYPKDKTKITGYIYEPWHLRYVGREAAQEITALDVTFEEYIAMVRSDRIQWLQEETQYDDQNP